MTSRPANAQDRLRPRRTSSLNDDFSARDKPAIGGPHSWRADSGRSPLSENRHEPSGDGANARPGGLEELSVELAAGPLPRSSGAAAIEVRLRRARRRIGEKPIRKPASVPPGQRRSSCSRSAMGEKAAAASAPLAARKAHKAMTGWMAARGAQGSKGTRARGISGLARCPGGGWPGAERIYLDQQGQRGGDSPVEICSRGFLAPGNSFAAPRTTRRANRRTRVGNNVGPCPSGWAET